MMRLPRSVEQVARDAQIAVEMADASVAAARLDLKEAESRLQVAQEALAYWSAVPEPVTA